MACPDCHTVFAPEQIPTAAWRRPPLRARPAPGDDPLVGSSLGTWRLTRLLGRGGMGRVFDAEDDGGRHVALKVLAADLAADPSFVRRFHREARVLDSLSHPHIVEILDRGEEGDQLWFAMEYVRGENLRRRVERGPLPPEEAVRIAAEIASALAYAHERGVVHRDLKPENVLLDEEGRVHLADFGLSRLLGKSAPEATTRLTRTDVILGTYEYMAPEQRRGQKDLDARSDLFALGVILYEMLTGILPVGRFDPPSQAVAGVPPALDTVVNRALAPNRSDRHASAEAFRDAMQDAWARRDESPTPPEQPSGRPGKQRRGTVALTDKEIAALRPVLRHADILGAMDRVLGLILVFVSLGFMSLAVLAPFGIRLVPVTGVASVALFVAGIVFLRLGKRLSRLVPEAREGQLTASVLLLFFPPVLTVMGIYGLWACTGDRARRAFAVGRKGLEGPRPIVVQKVVTVERPARRRGASFALVLLLLASIFWTAYASLVAYETATSPVDMARPGFGRTVEEPRQTAIKIAGAGTALSIIALFLAMRARHTRRGQGLAMAALLLFAATLVMLVRVEPGKGLAWIQPLHHAAADQPSLPRLEIQRCFARSCSSV